MITKACGAERAMMHYVHTGKAAVTSIKIDIFLLVTTRPIAHSGRFVSIPNCVGEFGTVTGQSLVTQKADFKSPVLSPQGVLHLYLNVHTNV